MTVRCYQVPPGQDGDEMAGYHLTGQNAFLHILEGGRPNHVVYPLLPIPGGPLDFDFWDIAGLHT